MSLLRKFNSCILTSSLSQVFSIPCNSAKRMACFLAALLYQTTEQAPFSLSLEARARSSVWSQI